VCAKFDGIILSTRTHTNLFPKALKKKKQLAKFISKWVLGQEIEKKKGVGFESQILFAQ